ncbi:type II toxin-antitoxin system Phd/YefM family antitoxin [Nocardia sp. NPDC052566]|uniref:type II toxin-antitoxin system Phd/YefM family antitoxin n=1 Tax=Nocardia sp. NPDC052566 TaxID=3364330 RepID=UPI0037CA2D96
MPALPISNVRQDLFGLVKRVNDDHDPVTVVTKTGENAVLVAESDWSSIMETLYVLQTHGGAQLLASADDARDGRTEAHVLLDPDDEPDTVPSAQTLWAITEKLEKLFGDYADATKSDDRFENFAREVRALRAQVESILTPSEPATPRRTKARRRA